MGFPSGGHFTQLGGGFPRGEAALPELMDEVGFDIPLSGLGKCLGRSNAQQELCKLLSAASDAQGLPKLQSHPDPHLLEWSPAQPSSVPGLLSHATLQGMFVLEQRHEVPPRQPGIGSREHGTATCWGLCSRLTAKQ